VAPLGWGSKSCIVIIVKFCKVKSEVNHKLTILRYKYEYTFVNDHKTGIDITRYVDISQATT